MKNKQALHVRYPIGTVITIGAECVGNPVGAKGVVFEHYTIGDTPGLSVLFENGRYDGFGEFCVEAFGLHKVATTRYLQNYEFISVLQLQEDFERGFFDAALQRCNPHTIVTTGSTSKRGALSNLGQFCV